MTRFADPTRTSTVVLGPCQCPGTPHEQDEALVRWDIGASAKARIGRAEIEGAVRLDPFASYRQLIEETLVSWNLLVPAPADSKDKTPVPAPITPRVISELDEDTLKRLAEQTDELLTNEGELPNDSSAPSPASSRESASPTRRQTRKRGT